MTESVWVLLYPGMTAENLGYLPSFIDPADPRPAREQINERYAHGGGWYPVQGYKLLTDNNSLHYPGDPPLHPVAFTSLRDEVIILYPHSWVAIVQPDKSYEVSRVD
jgi:hypothetical protein